MNLYTPDNIADKKYLEDISFPGEFPYLRGVHSTMYRGRLWTMRQFAGFGSAEETNKRYKYLLEHGETGLSVAFDIQHYKVKIQIILCQEVSLVNVVLLYHHFKIWRYCLVEYLSIK